MIYTIVLLNLIIKRKGIKTMTELELVQAVVKAVADGFAAGNSSPVVTVSEDGTQLVLTMTPPVVQTPPPVVTNFPVTNPSEPA